MKRRNPLDPYAYDNEPHPFEAGKLVGGGGSSQHGVHTSPNFDIAAVYAIRRSKQPGSGCGVVLALDVDGLDPISDIDAEVFSRMGSWVFDDFEFFELDSEEGYGDAVADAVDSADAKYLRYMLEDLKSMHDMGEYDDPDDPDDWEYMLTRTKHIGDELKVIDVLLGLPDDDLVFEMRAGLDGDGFSYSTWSAVIEQRRYFDPIDIDRLISVLCVWEPDEWDADDPNTIDPITEVIWQNSDLDGSDVDQVDYHGTDLTRAQKAFPELKLECL